MVIDLAKKAVLVTGAGSGIGKACAHTISEAGGIPWINDLDPNAAEQAAREVPNSRAIHGDVAQPDWTDPIPEIHAIVHCAGYDLYAPVGETDMSQFERLHRVMVSGPYALTQTLLPKVQPGGCVVFIASVHALATEPGISVYAGAKGAQISMVRGMAQDLGPKGIRVVSVCPGYIETPLMHKWLDILPDPPAAMAHAESLHPLGRIGRPEDVANLVTFLISPKAGFINGVNVVIDGGLTGQLMH